MNYGEGTIIKCPACGMIIDDTTTVCPACGTPIIGAVNTNEIKIFVDELYEYDRRIALEDSRKRAMVYKPPRTIAAIIGWIVLNFFLIGFPIAVSLAVRVVRSLFKCGKMSEAEMMKAQFVRNKVFSTPSSTAEGVRVASVQLDLLANEKFNANTSTWARIWSIKAEEYYQLARRYGENLNMLDSHWFSIQNSNGKVNKKLGLYTIWAALWILFYICMYNSGVI